MEPSLTRGDPQYGQTGPIGGLGTEQAKTIGKGKPKASEDMLTEGSVGGGEEPVLTKKDMMEDWNTMRYPYRIKKNYNLDHLARMNFKRADSSMSDKRIHPSKFNQRHILGGLRRK